MTIVSDVGIIASRWKLGLIWMGFYRSNVVCVEGGVAPCMR